MVDIYILVLAVLYINFTPKFAKLQLFVRFWRPDWPRFRQMLSIGLPSGGSWVMEHGLFGATAIMMGWVGVTQLAAHQIIAYGATFLAVGALFQLFDGVQITAGGILRGLNDTLVPMVLAFLGYWVVGIGGAYVMGFVLGYGGVGVWYGLMIGLGFCAIAVTLRFWRQTGPKGSAFHRIRG